jgi:WD40 repeat protein
MKTLLASISCLLLVISPALAQELSQPLPELVVITAENISEIRELLTWNIADTIWDLDFSPDSTRLAVGLSNNSTRILDIQTMHENAVFREDDSYWPMSLVVFSPDGTTLATASMNSWIRLWNIEDNGEMEAVYSAEPHHATDLQYSPDSNILAASFTDGVVRLFDVDSHDEIQLFGDTACEVVAIDAIAFEPSSELLAAGGQSCLEVNIDNSAIWVWNIQTGQLSTINRSCWEVLLSL